MTEEKRVDEIVHQINTLRLELGTLKSSNPNLALGYKVSPGGIINAYRECDLSHQEAVEEIENLCKTETIYIASTSLQTMGREPIVYFEEKVVGNLMKLFDLAEEVLNDPDFEEEKVVEWVENQCEYEFKELGLENDEDKIEFEHIKALALKGNVVALTAILNGDIDSYSSINMQELLTVKKGK